MDLILDILMEIASYSDDVWYKMTIANDEFALYSRGIAGIKMFRLLFTKDSGNGHYAKGTYVFGLLNSIEDEPAVVSAIGSFWYKNGKYHRDNDLPAIVFKSGTQKWYKDGQLHRDCDMPACIYSDGSFHYYINGKRHRINDCAIIRMNGKNKCWGDDIFIKKSMDITTI
jgi:hypothetical protein